MATLPIDVRTPRSPGSSRARKRHPTRPTGEHNEYPSDTLAERQVDLVHSTNHQTCEVPSRHDVVAVNERGFPEV